MKAIRTDRFESELHTFPDSAWDLLQRLPQQGGKLSSKTCNRLMDLLGVSLEELMIRLLPLAKVFSVVPISNFHVGAVALAGENAVDGGMNIYLGANMEFEHLPLNMSIHAEQAVAMNAWHQGAGLIKLLATSETSCGHCRQFLKELHGSTELRLLKPAGGENEHHSSRLAETLPGAFSPTELGNNSGFMVSPQTIRKLGLVHPSDDPVVQAALLAAETAYTPYTGNLAGCALQTPQGAVISGSYVESVAYNPSISPIHSTLLRLNLMKLEEGLFFDRMVLVEKPTRIRQKDMLELLVRSLAPHVELEYYIAQEEESS
jgi:cytidine deaminase